MPRNMIFGPKLLAFAVVLLTFMTAAATLMLADDRGPILKARSLQASYSSSFNVTVIDEDGRPIGPAPIGPATVKIVGNTTAPAGWKTDGNGSAVITGIFGNSTGVLYNLSVEASGFRTALEEVLAIENTTTNVTIVLVGGIILGKVMTATMPPVGIAGATVYIQSLGPRYSNQTNSLGQYIMKGIPEGQSYYIGANASGYIGVVSTVNVPITGSVDFTLTSQTGSIFGFVYNSATQAGLNGTNVSVRIGNSIIIVTSSANGSYEFSGVPPGTYAVTATKIGFYPNTTSGVIVTRENDTALNFSLTEKPTLLRGAVRSGTLLLVKANVSVVGTVYYNLSGPDGTYRITDLYAGTYTIQASRPGYVTAQFVVVIGAGEEKELNVNLTAIPGAILRGIVSSIVSDVKVPLVDVKVTLVTTNIAQNATSTNILGEFAFTGLAPGNYTVLFECADYRPMQVSGITVTNDSSASRQFLMTPIRQGFSGFIFGFDMPHSMMILGLFLTIAMLGVAVYLRIRTFQAPGSAPAIYDEDEDGTADEDSAIGQDDLEDRLSESNGKGKDIK
jgi:hypothetical protein